MKHPLLHFLLDDQGDMVERGLILVAIVVAAGYALTSADWMAG